MLNGTASRIRQILARSLTHFLLLALAQHAQLLGELNWLRDKGCMGKKRVSDRDGWMDGEREPRIMIQLFDNCCE